MIRIVGRSSARSRRRCGRCRCATRTRTARTTAPTPARTSSSPARCSRSRPPSFARREAYPRAVRVATFVSLAALLVVRDVVGAPRRDRARHRWRRSRRACSSSRSRRAGDGIVQARPVEHTVVYLGKISYGTYLWHWIVILVAVRTFHLERHRHDRDRRRWWRPRWPPLSFELLERPVRIVHAPRPPPPRRDRDRSRHQRRLRARVHPQDRRIPRTRQRRPSQGSTTAGFTPVPAGLDWEAASKGGGPFINCLRQARLRRARSCTAPAAACSSSVTATRG